jgi:CspA family cold shock protein
VNDVRTTGVVRKWDAAKGFGFIDPEGGGDSAFCHWRDIEVSSGTARRNLVPGQRVDFVRVDGPRGPRASNVRVLSAEDSPYTQAAS